MLTKQSLIAVLTGLNLFLLVALLLSLDSTPQAYAQGRAGRNVFASVTAKARGQSYDVLYLLDQTQGKLHAFYPTSIQQKKYAYGQFRDLRADFGD